MRRITAPGLLAAFILLAGVNGMFLTGADLTLKQILEKNIAAVGGREKLTGIRNYSFQLGPSADTTYYLVQDGAMKSILGREPVIRETIIVSRGNVRKNSLNELSEPSGLEKETLLCLAKLYSGCFSLLNFSDHLSFHGVKRFGPERHYFLTWHGQGLEIDFFVDAADFLLKRMVLRGFNPAGSKIESSHDYGPYQEIDGIRLPGSFFNSQVGGRGLLYEIGSVRFNPPMEEGFMSRLDVNAGEASAAPGLLKGNLVDFRGRGNQILVVTNLTRPTAGLAGLRSGEKLNVRIAGREFEVFYFDSQTEMRSATASLPSENLRILTYYQDDDVSLSLLLLAIPAADFAFFMEKLTPLTAIEISRQRP